MTGSENHRGSGHCRKCAVYQKQMERMAEIAQQGIKELLKAQKKVIASFA
jgi:hypothetical protein